MHDDEKIKELAKAEAQTSIVADAKTGEVLSQEKPSNVSTPVIPEVIKTPANPFQKLLASKQAALKNFLGNEHNALRFMSSVMHCMDKIPDLKKCEPNSLMGAFMECAALGLYPGTHSGDCYVLPYAGKAQFQIGYRGFKTLAFRAGILACGSDVVYENDKYREYRGSNPRIEHTVPMDGPRGEPIRAYAWAEVSPGKIVFKSMSEEEIMKIKNMSQASKSSYSPWSGKTDPMLWMWQKTCFKQLAKLLPTSEKLDRAVYADNVSERGGYFESEDQLIEVGFEDSETKIEIGKDRKQALRDKKKIRT
jgi:recombination protein RecT